MAKKRIFKIITIVAIVATLFVSMVVPAFASNGSQNDEQGDTTRYFHAPFAPDYRTSLEGAESTFYSVGGSAFATGTLYFSFDNTYVTNIENLLFTKDDEHITQRQDVTLYNWESVAQNGDQPIDYTRTISAGIHNSYDDLSQRLDYSYSLINALGGYPTNRPQSEYAIFGGQVYYWDEIVATDSDLDHYDWTTTYTIDVYGGYNGETDYTVKFTGNYLYADTDGTTQIEPFSLAYEPTYTYGDRDDLVWTISLYDAVSQLDNEHSIYRSGGLAFLTDVRLEFSPTTKNTRIDVPLSNVIGIAEETYIRAGRPDKTDMFQKWYNTYQSTTGDFNMIDWLVDTAQGVLDARLFGFGEFDFTLGGVLSIVVALALLKFFCDKFAGG